MCNNTLHICNKHATNTCYMQYLHGHNATTYGNNILIIDRPATHSKDISLLIFFIAQIESQKMETQSGIHLLHHLILLYFVIIKLLITILMAKFHCAGIVLIFKSCWVIGLLKTDKKHLIITLKLFKCSIYSKSIFILLCTNEKRENCLSFKYNW